MAKAKSPIPEGLHSVTPQLALDNAAKAIDWYKKAFGAKEISRFAGPDGKIMHAEVQIGDSHLMMNDVMMGGKGPKAYGGAPASFWIYVPDVDAVYNQAIAAGAKPIEGPMGASRISSGATAAACSAIPRATGGRSPRARKISRRTR